MKKLFKYPKCSNSTCRNYSFFQGINTAWIIWIMRNVGIIRVQKNVYFFKKTNFVSKWLFISQNGHFYPQNDYCFLKNNYAREKIIIKRQIFSFKNYLLLQKYIYKIVFLKNDRNNLVNYFLHLISLLQLFSDILYTFSSFIL